MLHNYLSDLISESRRDAADSGPRREQALADHRAICEAIARGGGPAAGAAMLQHVKTVEVLLVDALLAYRGALAPSEAGARARKWPKRTALAGYGASRKGRRAARFQLTGFRPAGKNRQWSGPKSHSR